MAGFTKSITILNSKGGRSGNRRWAFIFVDHATKRCVCAIIAGGDSNIRAIARVWGDVDDWDRSFLWHSQELTEREFDRKVKGWPYAGCAPEELAQFIKDDLARQENDENETGN